MHALDYVIIGVYFCITAGIGYWASRKKGDSEDLFLAGRSLGPFAVGFSLYAANVSSDTLIGLPGGAYREGISVGNYEWMAGLVLIFTAIFVLPVIMRSKVTTMPELMERRFDVRLRRYLSAVTLFLAIVLDTAASLYAGSIVVTTFFPGLSMWEMCLVLAAFTAVYTAAGGLRAVVFTDLMQAFVLLGGSIALLMRQPNSITPMYWRGLCDVDMPNATASIGTGHCRVIEPALLRVLSPISVSAVHV